MKAPREPILALDEIQGNCVVPFAKDHQAFLFLRVVNRSRARRWVARVAPTMARSSDVLEFNRLFSAMRARLGIDPPGLVVTWTAIAFSAAGLRNLVGDVSVEDFVDDPFKLGLATRSAVLGDPVDARSPGTPSRWVVGGPHNEADIVVLVASDRAELVDQEVAQILRTARGVETIHLQLGSNLPGKLSGHEHFGFRDGISQPGVRGRASRRRGDFLTPRLLDEADPNAWLLARPGRPLVWPGQFVFGYKQQDPHNPLRGAPQARRGPAWADNGSFIVIRRLTQDVAGFWRFAARTAALLRRRGAAGMTAGRVAALMVGRWPSGAPLMRSPLNDDPALGADTDAANNFGFAEAARALRLSTGAPDEFPSAPNDVEGRRCPVGAHIRKVNPRDTTTEQGGSRDTLTRLVLRRGIPFGPPAPRFARHDGERGLLFVAYQTSIDSQFEFLQRTWANTEDTPSPGGHDPVIGQSRAENGRRRLTLWLPDGRVETVTIAADFVTPTGGGYFFAPSLSALADVIGRD